MDLKQCPSCGATLPMDAALCTRCMTELGERTTIPVPGKRKKWLIPMGSVLALLLIVMLFLLLPQGDIPNNPDIYGDPPISESTGDEGISAENPPAEQTPAVPPPNDSTNESPPADTPEHTEGDTAFENDPSAGNDPPVEDDPSIEDDPPVEDDPSTESDPPSTAEEPDTQLTPDSAVTGTLYDNGTHQVVYTDGEDIFYVTGHYILYNDPAIVAIESNQYFSMTAGAQTSGNVTIPARVTILNRDEYDTELRERFWEKVASFRVVAFDVDGMNVVCVRSSREDRSDQTTAYQAQIGILSFGTGRLVWEFIMKNGDVIRVHTTIEVHPIVELELRPTAQEVPDIASLQAYLDSNTADLPRDSIVRVYLPGITYEGHLAVDDGVFEIYGASDQRTVIRGSATFTSRPGQRCLLQNITFVGSGGTGLTAQKALTVNNCTFSGYDIAIDWQDLAWVRLQNCTFRNNKIAMRVNNKSHHGTNEPNHNNLFENNGIALQFLKLSSDTPLTFPGSRFAGNETDIENTAGVAIDTHGAVFE